jgi:hypothetical protein
MHAARRLHRRPAAPRVGGGARVGPGPHCARLRRQQRALGGEAGGRSARPRAARRLAGALGADLARHRAAEGGLRLLGARRGARRARRRRAGSGPAADRADPLAGLRQHSLLRDRRAARRHLLPARRSGRLRPLGGGGGRAPRRARAGLRDLERGERRLPLLEARRGSRGLCAAVRGGLRGHPRRLRLLQGDPRRAGHAGVPHRAGGPAVPPRRARRPAAAPGWYRGTSVHALPALLRARGRAESASSRPRATSAW